MYPKQSIYELRAPLKFGKYKGLSIRLIYGGNPYGIINGYMRVLHTSFEKIFSADAYKFNDDKTKVTLLSIEGVNVNKWLELILALNDGAQCSFKINGENIKILVKKQGLLDEKLSKFACELAIQYMSGEFHHGWVDGLGKLRVAMESLSVNFNDIESKLDASEPNSKYIDWCIRNVDGFCLPGNENEITGLDEIPMFDFGSFKTKEIKDDFSFDFEINLRVHFKSADERTISENYKKLTEYLEQERVVCAPQEQDSDNDEEYYDSDDDEGNIMRGLDSGNGDQFGF